MPSKSPAQGYCQREFFESEILPRFLAKEIGATLPWRREAIILGGQPSAGAAALMQLVRQALEQNGTTWTINGNEFYTYHPMCADLRRGQGIAATRRIEGDIRAWVAMTLDAAQERGVNIALESTMRPLGTVVEQLRGLRDSNYKVQACVLAVKEQERWQGIYARHEHVAANGGYSRLASKAMHAAGVTSLVKAVEFIEGRRLVDRIIVRNRNGDLILDNGKIKKNPAADAITKECNTPFSAKQIAEHTERWDDIETMAMERHRRDDVKPMRAAQELSAIRTQRRVDELTLTAERDCAIRKVAKNTTGDVRE